MLTHIISEDLRPGSLQQAMMVKPEWRPEQHGPLPCLAYLGPSEPDSVLGPSQICASLCPCGEEFLQIQHP